MYGYGNGWGMMGGGYGSMGGFQYGVLAIGTRAARWRRVLVHAFLTVNRLYRATLASARPGGLDVLEQRYARGEVNREEYLQKKGDLQA